MNARDGFYDQMPARTPSFATDSNRVRPSFILLNLVATCLNQIRHDLPPVFSEEMKMLELLRDTYVRAHALACSNEVVRREFSHDVGMHQQKLDYLMRTEKADLIYQAALASYNAIVDKLQSELRELNEQMQEVQRDVSLGVLRDSKLYNHLHREIEMRLSAYENILSEPGCFSGFFCRVPAKIKYASAEIDKLQQKKIMLESNNPASVRLQLSDYLTTLILKKKIELEEVMSNKPMQNNLDRKSYINIEAKIRSDEYEFYSCINHGLMLDLVKMYLIITRISESRIRDTVKTAFRELKKAYLTLSASFYCEEPGRYYFDHYLKNLCSVTDKKILNSILSGNADEKQIRLVIPNYGSIPKFHCGFSQSFS